MCLKHPFWVQKVLEDAPPPKLNRVNTLKIVSIFQMTTTDRTSTPATGAAATYGQYPYICGTNTGYHCQ